MMSILLIVLSFILIVSMVVVDELREATSVPFLIVPIILFVTGVFTAFNIW